MQENAPERWGTYIERYRKGEWRAPIFCDLIVDEAQRLRSERGELTMLDIGCGGGFDSNAALQSSLAEVASAYWGIEPDPEMDLSSIFTRTYRCLFEDVPLEQESVDIAFACMVLEHFANPQVFWDKVWNVLKPGGVFWGFTVDARHPFVSVSVCSERLHLKDWYLNRLHGHRGTERYENYSVFYRSNSPATIRKMTTSFTSTEFLNFHKEGQLDYYIPKPLRWIGRAYDRCAISCGLPGSILAVRVVK